MFSFNPHTHAGCDQIQRDWQEKMWGFNPHTHAGCDCITLSRSYRIAHGFNPHTHAGCDSTKAPPKPSIKVSIHTPTQGVTFYSCNRIPSALVSIHTPTQGVTSEMAKAVKTSAVSIHTPTQGVTAMQRQWQTDMWFQSTHPRRV